MNSAQHKSLVLLWEEHDSKQLYLVLKVSCRSTGNVSTSCNNQKKKKNRIMLFLILNHLRKIHFHSFRSLSSARNHYFP